MTPPYTQPLPPPGHPQNQLLEAAKTLLEVGVKDKQLLDQLVQLISNLETVTVTAKKDI